VNGNIHPYTYTSKEVYINLLYSPPHNPFTITIICSDWSGKRESIRAADTINQQLRPGIF